MLLFPCLATIITKNHMVVTAIVNASLHLYIQCMVHVCILCVCMSVCMLCHLVILDIVSPRIPMYMYVRMVCDANRCTAEVDFHAAIGLTYLSGAAAAATCTWDTTTI